MFAPAIFRCSSLTELSAATLLSDVRTSFYERHIQEMEAKEQEAKKQKLMYLPRLCQYQNLERR
jgi:hypothetical protein